jgi:hypothetical protein
VLLSFIPRVDSGWYLVLPLAITGSGLGLLVSQLSNFTLGPIEEERISQAAGVEAGTVLPPAQRSRITEVLDGDAEVTSNTQLEGLLADEPPAVQA